ncbi:hypothetical protein ACNKHW_26055 [Shigella flexneri]
MIMNVLNRRIFPPLKACICGDGTRRDEDGYYWITGRVDDVLNISGHRLGTAEWNPRWFTPENRRSAVVGIPHSIKGQAIYAYVTLNHGEEPHQSCMRGEELAKRSAPLPPGHPALDRLPAENPFR